MHTKIIAKILLLASICIMLFSCGSQESAGGGVTEFKTSNVTATAATTRLEADLITGNTCSATGSTGGTIDTELVDFTITATSTATNSTPLPVSITGYTVTFVPKNAGIPALTPLTGTTSRIINPTSVTTISVPITTDLQKINLIAANNALPCSLNIYQYDVFVNFSAVEVGVSGDKSVTASLVMAMADRNNLQ